MTGGEHISTNGGFDERGYCTACGERRETAWRFCPACGTSAGVAAVKAGPAPVAAIPVSMPAPIGPVEPETDTTFVPLPGMAGGTTPAPARRKRRRHRRPFYRKKRVLIPSTLLILLVAALVPSLYWTGSTISSLRQVSTPPPEIVDGTYLEEDDPTLSGGPITVQTGPAQAALDAAYEERDLPRHSNDGFGSMWRNVSSGASDIAGGVAVATGLTTGSDDSFTMLVMGVDARPGSPIDVGVRPDVLMVVQFDAASQSCRALSVPRDTRVELPGYGESKINHALMVGGIPYQILVTEDFLGVEIDHYVLIDFVAFERIVDSVGGITVDVPETLTRNGELHFREGIQDFEGEQALAYARFRSGPEADRARIQRQWGVLASIADELEGSDLVSDITQVTATTEDHLRTDLPAADITSLAKTYGGTCSSMNPESVSMLAGTWAHFEDPILGRTEIYNYVEPAEVERQVDALLNGVPADEPGTPEPATESGTPEPSGT